MPLSARCRATILAASLLAAWPALAIERIGNVQTVRVFANGTPPGQDKVALYAQDPLFQEEVVETVGGGGLLAIFNDGSQLTLGSATRMKLDRFVYASGQGKDAMVLTMVRGALRFVTGKIDKPAFTLKTPQATIGIRGTDFTVQVNDETTTVSVSEGAVTVTPRGKDRAITLNAGNAVRITLRGLVEKHPVLQLDELNDQNWDQDEEGAGGGGGEGGGH